MKRGGVLVWLASACGAPTGDPLVDADNPDGAIDPELFLVSPVPTIYRGDAGILRWSMPRDAAYCRLQGGFGRDLAVGNTGAARVWPTATIEYVVSCPGGRTPAEARATLTVIDTAGSGGDDTGYFLADAWAISPGQRVLLEWSVTTEAQACWIAPSGDPVSPVGQRSVEPVRTTDYAIRCGDSEPAALLTVTVRGPPEQRLRPDLFLAVSPGTVHDGATARLELATGEGAYCSIPRTFGFQLDASAEVSPSRTTTYQLTCPGGAELVDLEVTLVVPDANPRGACGVQHGVAGGRTSIIVPRSALPYTFERWLGTTSDEVYCAIVCDAPWSGVRLIRDGATLDLPALGTSRGRIAVDVSDPGGPATTRCRFTTSGGDPELVVEVTP